MTCINNIQKCNESKILSDKKIFEDKLSVNTLLVAKKKAIIKRKKKKTARLQYRRN